MFQDTESTHESIGETTIDVVLYSFLLFLLFETLKQYNYVIPV